MVHHRRHDRRPGVDVRVAAGLRESTYKGEAERHPTRPQGSAGVIGRRDAAPAPGRSAWPLTLPAQTISETARLIRPVRPEEDAGLGELTVAAYHSLPGETPHQQVYDERLRDLASRAGTSRALVAVGSAGELPGGATYVAGPDDPYSRICVRQRPGSARRRRSGLPTPAPSAAPDLGMTARARAAGRGGGPPHERVDARRETPLRIVWLSSVMPARLLPVPGIDLIGYALEPGPPMDASGSTAIAAGSTRAWSPQRCARCRGRSGTRPGSTATAANAPRPRQSRRS